jgi:simple sugar transport system ATP-binding protein
MGSRQRVEILKALYRDVELLILDEPTTNLTPQEVDSLFLSLRAMVEEGMSVLFITHKLREVLSVCDRISVLRDGRRALTQPRHEVSEALLVKEMVGAELDLEQSVIFSQAGIQAEASQKPLLQVTKMGVAAQHGRTRLVDVSLQLYAKEILGIAGVAGNGQQELAEGLLGIRPLTQGHILFDGRNVTNMPTRKLLAMGVAYIPEDRQRDGYLPTANVAQNLILGAHRHQLYNKGGLLNWKAIYQAARLMIAEYKIQTPGPREVAANLSGGNIQRLMIARAFWQPLRLLIAHNPTSGLDIPSTEFVYSKLLQHKNEGMATLLLSDDLDQLLLLCDRIATLYRGQLVGLLERNAFDKYEIGRLMSGAGNEGNEGFLWLPVRAGQEKKMRMGLEACSNDFSRFQALRNSSRRYYFVPRERIPVNH